ncbi:hypothetical protein [Candidatus Magnetaquicoccus inordinatus]|nr:hypothetical protein [Candidatus Magnetaquicoccus inordinatus]
MFQIIPLQCHQFDRIVEERVWFGEQSLLDDYPEGFGEISTDG